MDLNNVTVVEISLSKLRESGSDNKEVSGTYWEEKMNFAGIYIPRIVLKK